MQNEKPSAQVPAIEEEDPIQPLINVLKPYKSVIGGLPFVLFVTEALLATVCCFIYKHTDPFLIVMFSQLLAVNFVLAGLLHFYKPMYEFYTSMIFLPFKDFWLYLSGVTFFLGGAGVAISSTRSAAAKLLVCSLIGVFPGNVACVFMEHPRKVVFGGSMKPALARLPFQIPMIIWAWWMVGAPTL